MLSQSQITLKANQDYEFGPTGKREPLYVLEQGSGMKYHLGEQNWQE